MSCPEVKAKYDRRGPIYALVFELVEALHRTGLTRAQLAERMRTTQSAIARLENTRHMPSLGMAARYAEAVGQRLDIHVHAAE
jgi:transcriptional regulator with XRE-family HTH domain